MRLLRLLPRFREAYRALPAMEAREKWSRAEIETFQLGRLNRVWRHAAAHVPYYRRLAEDIALPPRFASLAEFRAAVPALSKNLVRDQPVDFLSERARPGGWDQTSGSTGTPLRVYWSREAHQEMLRGKYRFQAAWGLDIFAPCVFLWGRGKAVLPGLLGRAAQLRQSLEDKLRNRLRLSAYDLGHDRLRSHLRRIAAFRPAWIYGFSRAVALLAHEAAEVGSVCPSLDCIVLTSETASPSLVGTVEKAFGVPAVVEYGSVECGLIAYQGRDRSLRICEDQVFLETLPLPNGRFKILVTVLNNPCFPLLRYAIGDATDARLETPGQGFAILRGLVGRSNDLIVSRSGRYVHSTRFEAVFEYEVQTVRRFRVHQGADGTLAVAVELDKPTASLDAVWLERKLEELTEGYPVKLRIVETIPSTAAGKHNPVTSDLRCD
jgi:phenylacetate-CoA ligase